MSASLIWVILMLIGQNSRCLVELEAASLQGEAQPCPIGPG